MSDSRPCLDLRPDHLTLVQNILQKYVPDRKVLAFGSRATWTAQEYSDLDLAILGDGPLSLSTSSALNEAFSDSDLPFKVDVVDLAMVDISFRDVIVRSGVVVQVPINPHAAAHILGMLDNKIELNRRMNETLEAMAKEIFKNWFVDFGPTRAKIRGHDTGLSRHISALFPERLVVSDIGEVPEGWTTRPLSELIQLNYGKELRKDKRKPGNYPVYGSGGSDTSHAEPLVEHPTIIVGRKGTVGSVYWAPRGCWPMDATYFITSKLPMTFIYRLLQHLPLTDMNADTGVPYLSRSKIYRLNVLYPGIELVSKFAEYAHLLQSRIDVNEREMQLMTHMRDLLLPKLISGELCVPATEKFL